MDRTGYSRCLLWTQESVTFRGRRHIIVEAGLDPMPVQRPERLREYATMRAGLAGPDAHIEAVRRFFEAVGG